MQSGALLLGLAKSIQCILPVFLEAVPRPVCSGSSRGKGLDACGDC